MSDPGPVLDAVAPRLEQLRQEWQGRTTAKQRLTGTRLHRQLVEEGYLVGITTVREYLKEQRRRAAEVYIPPVHRPGEEGQMDFFQVTGGVEVPAALALLGAGLPKRLVYDNLTAAVKRLVRSHRELTDRFLDICSHYLFEPCFARPGEGHDKGGVEARGVNAG